jgi:diguanylate cyclase (GGDEF)-like protein
MRNRSKVLNIEKSINRETPSAKAWPADLKLDGTLNKVLPSALNCMHHAIAICDNRDRLVYCNDRYREIYGITPDDLRPGATVAEVFTAQARAFGLIDQDAANYVAACFEQMPIPFTGVRKLPDGRAVRIERRLMADGYSVSTHEDVTDRLHLEERIRFAAHHDALTQLPNRVLFLETIEKALPRVRRGDRIALLLIDLDRFKQVNDTHGHGIGDALLTQVSKRLRHMTRDTDTVARLGGDEFAVLQVPAPEPLAAERLAARLVEELGKPYKLGDRFVMIGVSIGIAMATEAVDDVDTLMHHADFAMYRSKNEGRGTYRFFEEQLDAQMRKRRDLEARIRQALVLDEFELHYQPILNLERSRVETLEALLRWNSEGTWISPGEFIPVAEESGLVLALGDWVLRRACRDALRLPEHIRVAVNVSPLQFQSGNVLDTVQSALKQCGLPPSRLEIEITETVLLDTSHDVLTALRQIQEMGVSIALDDFGTGYSSLKYLTSFGFNKLKIDRSFVSGLPQDQDKLAVLRAMAGLGRDLGMRTTVEGVETNDQWLIAGREHCSEVQGFLFAKPTPVADLEATIAEAERHAGELARAETFRQSA